jgi:hypothetical protein
MKLFATLRTRNCVRIVGFTPNFITGLHPVRIACVRALVMLSDLDGMRAAIDGQARPLSAGNFMRRRLCFVTLMT